MEVGGQSAKATFVDMVEYLGYLQGADSGKFVGKDNLIDVLESFVQDALRYRLNALLSMVDIKSSSGNIVGVGTKITMF